MADIELEHRPQRSGGSGWIWGLVALLAIAAVIWWAWPDDDTVVLDDEIETVEPVTEPAPQRVETEEGLQISQILASPQDFEGRTVSGEAHVAELAGDRAFWIEDQGQRMLVVIDVREGEEAPQVEEETTVRLQSAAVRGADDVEALSERLDEETRDLLRDEEAFLLVSARDIELEAGPPSGDEPDARDRLRTDEDRSPTGY